MSTHSSPSDPRRPVVGAGHVRTGAADAPRAPQSGVGIQRGGLRVGQHGIAAILVAALAGCASLPPPTLPTYEASITRTRFGIPHITAADYRSLGFGAAYARAQDNICLLADIYLTFAGQRSRYFGADGMATIGLAPASNLDSDVFHQVVLDLPRLHGAFAQRTDAYRDLVDGWIVGYNRFLADHRNDLPAECAGQPWVREISRDDVLRSLNGFAILASSGAFGAHLSKATPPTADTDSTASLPPLPHIASDTLLAGSNGWAFGADATHNGKGLVLGNPHFPWMGANRFYQTHLTIPGELDVAGAAIIHLPYVGIGFNRDVAWTHTMDMAAHMTAFKLTLDPADPTVYLVDGQRQAMTRRDIRIDTLDGEPVTRTVYASRYGPVISIPDSPYAWTRQTAYALADANNGNLRSGDTWLGFAKARNVRDVREALAQHLGAPFLNTLAADRSGDALYADIGAIPNVSAERLADCGGIEPRPPGHLQELVVLDGSRSACAWKNSGDAVVPDLLPPDQMATLYRRDYVQNSNDSYRWANPAELIRLGPIMGRDPGLGRLRTRAGIEAIEQVLAAGKFDIEVAADAMFSNHVLAAELVLPSVLQLCQRSDAPAGACAALAAWDGQAQLESRGAMLFGNFWATIDKRSDIWRIPFDPDDMRGTPRDLIADDPQATDILHALKAAADAMTERGLALDAALGDVQFVQRGEERIPISGLQSGGTLNYTAAMPVDGGYAVIFGASYVQAVGFDEHGPVANTIVTYSQSADPASPHYADQTREFSKKRLHRFPFSAAEIAADEIDQSMTIRQ